MPRTWDNKELGDKELFVDYNRKERAKIVRDYSGYTLGVREGLVITVFVVGGLFLVALLVGGIQG